VQVLLVSLFEHHIEVAALLVVAGEGKRVGIGAT
jgi:hypothetical protein